MGLHFTQVAVIADVVTNAVLIHIGIGLFLAAESLGDRKSLENGAGVRLASTQIVNLGHAGSCKEGGHKPGDIE